MPIESGRYFIINCRPDATNLAYLNNPNSGEPLRARFQRPLDDLQGDQWDVINHGNGHHSIRNVGHKTYAVSGSRSKVNAHVTGEDEYQMWRIEKTRVKGQYTIAPTDSISDRFLCWGLVDVEQNTPIMLAKVPTDSCNWWIFKNVKTGKDAELEDKDSENRSTSDNYDARAVAGIDNDRETHFLSGRPLTGNMDEQMRRGLERLEERAVTSAFHNSAMRVNPPRCHPNTRVSIQDQIFNWILMNLLIRQTWIMWMVGAAGAGKSAIMQSIADRCEEEHIPLASFFFLRTDATRNSMERVFATLIYQLIQIIPQARNEILTIIEQDPLIFRKSLATQLQKLIIDPLLRVRAHFKGFFVLLIDGLDECIDPTHQSELIKLLGAVSRSRTIPVIFLVASRREPQIEAAFIPEVSDFVLTIALDTSDVEQSADDIRHFLDDKFSDLKKNHLFKKHLSVNWPAPSIVNEIVDKSSGQFIFASIVIKYISSPDGNPAHQLEVVRGIRPRGPSDNPFAHLDALYEHIFSQVGRETLDKVRDIIAFAIATKMPYIDQVLLACQIEPSELGILFVKLRSIIQCGDSELRFLHASLPDFLLDKHRSGEYYIDLDHYRTKLICMLLTRDPPILDPLSGLSANDLMGREWNRLFAVFYLFDRAPPSGVKVSKELHSAFMNFKCTFYSNIFLEHRYPIGPDIVGHVKRLDFSDWGKAYRHVMRTFAAEYAKYWPLFSDHVKADIAQRAPDLMAHIKKIRRVSIFKKIVQYLTR